MSELIVYTADDGLTSIKLCAEKAAETFAAKRCATKVEADCCGRLPEKAKNQHLSFCPDRFRAQASAAN